MQVTLVVLRSDAQIGPFPYDLDATAFELVHQIEEFPPLRLARYFGAAPQVGLESLDDLALEEVKVSTTLAAVADAHCDALHRSEYVWREVVAGKFPSLVRCQHCAELLCVACCSAEVRELAECTVT